MYQFMFRAEIESIRYSLISLFVHQCPILYHGPHSPSNLKDYQRNIYVSVLRRHRRIRKFLLVPIYRKSKVSLRISATKLPLIPKLQLYLRRRNPPKYLLDQIYASLYSLIFILHMSSVQFIASKRTELVQHHNVNPSKMRKCNLDL
jgi:hypothetical protein